MSQDDQIYSSDDLLQKLKEAAKEYASGHGEICPHCGYCPTCGRRGGYGTYPWYLSPNGYWWYTPTTTTSGYVQQVSGSSIVCTHEHS